MTEHNPRHLWVRMGGPTFCGKEGCGLIRTPKTEQMECEGEESAGIKFFRGEARSR
jgi:hypothetical protein